MTRALIIATFAAATIAASIYALSVGPSHRDVPLPPAPASSSSSTPIFSAPPKPLAPPPPSSPAPSPSPPSAAPTPPPQPTPPPASTALPGSLEDLHLTDEEDAAIKPIVDAGRARMEHLKNEYRAHRLDTEQFGEAMRREQLAVFDQLSAAIGADRAKQFIALTRGRLPDRYASPDEPAK